MELLLLHRTFLSMIFKHHMLHSWIMIVIGAILLAKTPPIDGLYHYAGCYTQVFYETLFTSSFMEPTLCFRLCDTPIIYLQKTICRCSGGGLMHHKRQEDKSCTIPCSKPADRQVQTANTCGGQRTYSAYVEEDFYTQHGHLFNYQINFFACELWKSHDVYDTVQVSTERNNEKSSLNRMERCAAACLDSNTTTKSIAFNDDNNQCLCIMPWKSNTAFQRSNYLTILPNSSCNRYCNNTSEDSNVDHQFQCGALNDPHIWAIYDLNGTCPMDYIYIKEFKKCLHTYKNFWNSCTPPAKSYVFDGSVSWNDLLKMIDRLNLNQTLVAIDFDEDVVVNSSWKCLTTSTDSSSLIYSRSYSTYHSWNPSTRYILDSGCLRESSYSFYAHRYSNRLCIANPLNKYSISPEDMTNSTYIAYVGPQLKLCPTDWFDLNGRCYRMSDEKKTIPNARNSCITVTEMQLNKTSKSHIWNNNNDDDDSEDYDEDQLNDSPKGDIVQYTSEWQARLGFFLLDTIPDTDNSSSSSINLYYEDLVALDTPTDIYHSLINEFQMINPSENKNSSLKDNSCVIAMRITNEVEERPELKSDSTKNCSIPKHVLCETKTMIVRDFQQGCFEPPTMLDLPAIISNRLTYELCLSVCQELLTRLAILQMNKCYCLNGINSKTFNLSADLVEYQMKDCGNSCPGNQHERCGDEATVVIFYITDPRRTVTEAATPAQPFPDFAYDGCINIVSLNSSMTYQFSMDDIHPRICLKFCIEYKQIYALISGDQCFCTNIPWKNDESSEILSNNECSLKCSGNYLYTCGNGYNGTKYSMYVMKPQCRHGFDVAANDQQCVYTHLSVKKSSLANAESFCRSIGGHIAKINDLVEINSILSDSLLNLRVLRLLPFYYYKFVNITRYFWINRTSQIADNLTQSSHFLKKCSDQSGKVDPHCLVIRQEPVRVSTPFNLTFLRLCIAESNQCSTESAMPFCVDQHLDPKPTILPSGTGPISRNITIDYSCGDDPDYHFVDDYCYKIRFHEVSWNEAKSECEKEKAMLFIPEKSPTLHIIKSLFLRRNAYTSSGFAHVGVMYDNDTRTVIQYNTTDGQSRRTVPDSNVVYDLCEKSFIERYTALMSINGLSISERNRLKSQQIGCAYIDLLSYSVPVIRCDEIPCNRTATVICQKLPAIITDIITVQRKNMDVPVTTEIPDVNISESTRSIGRDFAPIFFILATLFALILLEFISTLYNHRLYQRNQTIFSAGRRNTNSVYSPLTSANEFDMN